MKEKGKSAGISKTRTDRKALYAKSRAHSDEADMEGHLTDCEKLKPKVYCDHLYLSEILPLLRRRPKTCVLTPVTLPTREIGKLCRLSRNPKYLFNRLGAFVLASERAVYEAGLTYAVLEAEIARMGRERGEPAEALKGGGETYAKPQKAASAWEKRTLKLDEKERGAVLDRATAHLQRLRERYSGPSPLTQPVLIKPRQLNPPFVGPVSLVDNLRGLIADLPIPQPDEAKPALGFEITYRQDWCSRGYRRGRLVRSIPLPADGRREIIIKSWTIRKERREENESVENDISTEIVGDEKWSHATTKQLSAELNQTVDANLKANGEIPIKGAKVGAEAGAGSATSGTVAGSITDTEERIHQATIKVTDSLKKKVSSSVETSEEAGLETTVTETIVNPNKCNTLTYHFFEVTELYEVTTRVHSLSPVLLVALPSPSITPEWLLCHECLLKKHLPCETYYAGFEAAKTVLSRTLLGEFLGSLESEEVQQATDVALDAVEAVVAAYLSLKNATISLEPAQDGGGNVLENAWNNFQNGLNEFGEQAGEFLEGVAEDAGEFIEDTVETVGQIIEGIGEGFEAIGSNVGGWFSSQPLMAHGGAVAFSVAHTPGGIGSYIYWQVSEISAPELGNALAGLEAAHTRIAAMPAGPAKVNALIGALRSFFTTLGDVDEVFNKINTGLAVVAAGLAATTFGGAAAVIAFIAVTGVVTIPIALALLGAAAVFALGELVVLIAGLLFKDQGIDIVPDDEGLKSAIGGLYGLFEQLGQSADLPAPPQSDDPADTAAYQQELQEAKRRRRELAEARVELDRLTCHIRENRAHYAQVHWSSVSSADLERVLHGEFNIPPHFVEPKIAGFDGAYAAFRVTNLKWLKLSGIDVEQTMKELADSGLFENVRQTAEIEMPTRGLTVEPELGSCDACDDFVHFHREQDKLLKAEEVEQAKLETQRLQERINRGLLSDPTPFEGAASVSVSTTVPLEPDTLITTEPENDN